MKRSCIVALTLIFAGCFTAFGQTSSKQLDVKFIPQDAIALISVRPHEISELDEIKMMPTEVATAAGKS